MKILIVDDESLVRRALVRAFRLRGHEVLDAPDAETGLRLWQQERPEVLVVDVLMPGMSGPEMILKAQQIQLSYRLLVFISAFTGTENISEKELGPFIFIAKPFEDIFSVIGVVESEFDKI